MSFVRNGKAVLEGAEASLRDLAAKAAADGDYDSIFRLVEWAKAIQDLIKSTTLPEVASDGGGAEVTQKDAVGATKRTAIQKSKAAREVTAITRRKEYPIFVREDDSLIKIAWSKSAKAEYEHKAPSRILSTLAGKLDRLGSKKRLISMDKVLPLKEDDGSDVPAYQAYICLGFLKQNGLIIQHGRQGYSAKAGLSLRDAAIRVWRQLGERQRS